jgi:FHA domain-containing protein
MALTLRLRSGDVDPEPELPFEAPRVVIGRAPGCDLQLPDPSISPRHASLRQRGGEYVVVDEGSDNGTFLGATRLPRHAPHVLRDRDLLRFGRVWVGVRLGPAEHVIEVQASRELARRLVDAALVADGKACGMTVSAAGADDASLCLAEPRRAYTVGGKKGSDLRIPGLPSRALELRRQADQLWVTLQDGAEATLGERALVKGQRTAWPKNVELNVGEVRLAVTDPTAQMLECLEREPTERLAENAVIDPPSGGSTGAAAEDDDGAEDDRAAEDWGDEEEEDADGSEEDDGDEPAHGQGAIGTGGAIRAARTGGGWSKTDAIVFFLALSVLGLSLWAIRWLAQIGSA